MCRLALLYLLFFIAGCRFYTAEGVFPNLTISKADPYDYVYGIVNSTVDATFTVTNDGDGPATDLQAGISNSNYQFKGGSFPGTGGTCATTLGVKESCTIVVQFSPTSIADRVQATLNLSYLPSPKNDRLTTSKILIGDSIIGAILTISDGTTYDYGRVSIATPADKTFTITNTGTHPASQIQPSVATTLYSLPGGGTCGTTLAAGASCTLIVRFSPAFFVSSNDTFTVSYNNMVDTSSVSRSVTGTGVGAPGAVDTTFAAMGIATTSMGASKESLQAAYLDASNRLYLVGTVDFGVGTNALAIIRYENGGTTVDTNYSTSGLLIQTIPGLVTSALQTDGKLITKFGTSIVRWNTDGTRDTAFASPQPDFSGIVTSYGMTVQTDGKSVIVGERPDGDGNTDFAAIRLLTTGQLDTTFCTSGFLNSTIIPNWFANSARAVIEQGIGGTSKLVVVGVSKSLIPSNDNAYQVGRMQSNGAMDTSFATQGLLLYTLGTGNNSAVVPGISGVGATSVLIDGSNQIVVGGTFWYSPAAAGPNLYDNWGKLILDSTGKFISQNSFAISENQIAKSLGLRSGGTISIVGSEKDLPRDQMVVKNARAGATLTITYGSGNDEGVSILIATGTNFLSLGHAQTLASQNQNQDFAFAQIKSNDTLDTSFDTDGKKTLNLFNAADSRITQVLVQTDGKTIGIGVSYWGGQYSVAVARYETNGSIDTSFKTAGYLLQSFSSATSPYTVSGLLQTNGRITLGALFNSTSRLITFKTDGTLDTSFYTTGLSDSATPPTTVRELNSVRQGTDGLFYVSGNSGNNLFIQRYTANGGLDTSFHTVGYKEVNTGVADGLNALAFDGNGSIWGAGYTQTAGNYDFIIAHYFSDGRIDTSFKTVGYVISTVGTGNDYANSIVIDSAGKIIISGTATESHTMTGHIRFLTNGNLDTTFSTDGKLLISYGNTAILGTAGTVLDSSGYLIGGFSLSAAPHSFGLYRITSSGNLDTQFASNGFSLTTVAGTNGAATSLAPLSDGKYAIGGYAYQDNNFRNPVLIRVWP